MYFILLGYDGTDDSALDRRMAARDAHLAGAKALKETGNLLFAAALQNDQGDMCGSMLAMSFESRDDLDAWLKTEPYTLGNVWDKVEIHQCAIPPMFLGQ